ncbi:MAG: class II fructose-bisphosphate aldolase [Ruminococcus sp.]|nr:class II fructose-bisphosphate aldolase [Candidatus Copronaster equi]
MVTSSAKLMRKASREGYAIPSFGIDNLESAMAVSEVMHEMRIPVIISTVPQTLDYGGIAMYTAMMRELMADCSVDYAFHLDHGDSLSLIKKCIASGYTSVMFDGSEYSYAENLTKTKEVTDYALLMNVSIEGKLSNPDVEQALEFITKTNISSLAVGSGIPKGKTMPEFNIKKVAEIHSATETPLVLHGASGMSDDDIRDCIAAGISKINFSTELRHAFTEGLKDGIAQNPDSFDPKVYLRNSVDNMKEVIKHKIKICYNI